LRRFRCNLISFLYRCSWRLSRRCRCTFTPFHAADVPGSSEEGAELTPSNMRSWNLLRIPSLMQVFLEPLGKVQMFLNFLLDAGVPGAPEVGADVPLIPSLVQVFLEPLKKVQVEGFVMCAEPEVLFGNLDELCCVSRPTIIKLEIWNSPTIKCRHCLKVLSNGTEGGSKVVSFDS